MGERMGKRMGERMDERMGERMGERKGKGGKETINPLSPFAFDQLKR